MLVVFLLFFGLLKWMNMRNFQLLGDLTSRVETNEKVVALTFDDGPTENVDEILPLLDQYKAKATFFLIGSEIADHPEEAKKIAESGHQIGNHTYSHERMVFKTPSFVKEELEKTDDLIRQAGFEGEIDFRPPFGKKLVVLPFYLKQRGMETIMWDLEPDTYYNTTDEKVEYIVNHIKPGSIILLHPMVDQTGMQLQVIEEILQELTDDGYRFVTVNELQEFE
ncbi:polysaccharide deacetylase family protein [Ureibacillus sp. NPDC094379]